MREKDTHTRQRDRHTHTLQVTQGDQHPARRLEGSDPRVSTPCARVCACVFVHVCVHVCMCVCVRAHA